VSDVVDLVELRATEDRDVILGIVSEAERRRYR